MRHDRCDEQELASLAAGNAAGNCWAKRPGGGGRCTLPPGHSGDHMDYYNGRSSVTATTGHRWPQ